MKTLQIIGIVLSLIIFFFAGLINSKEHKDPNRALSVKNMARIGVFGAIATILYVVPIFNFTIPGILPTFMKFHFDEIPAMIAGFAFGPIPAFFIIVIKTLIKLPLGGASSMFVGEISDFIYSCAFVLPAAIIYKHHRKFKYAALGLGIGFVSQIITSLLCNVFIMVPAYMYFFKLDEAGILRMMPPFITNVTWSYSLVAVLPFNVVKNILVIGVTLLIYKPLHRLIEKIHA